MCGAQSENSLKKFSKNSQKILKIFFAFDVRMIQFWNSLFFPFKSRTKERPWVETVPELRRRRSHGERGVTNGRVLSSQYDGRGLIRTGPWKWTASISKFWSETCEFHFQSHHFFLFSFQLSITAIRRKIFFWIFLLMKEYGINLDTEMISHTVFSESVILPDSKQNHTPLSKKWSGKYFPLNGRCRKLRKKQKSVMTGSRTGHIPLQNLGRDVVYFQGPVRVQSLPSYCERTIRFFAPSCSPWERPCLNSGTFLGIRSF